MKTLTLIQGTPEWHAHRATHFNASDAPAMLGCSPYKSRAQLVREVATGLCAEIDDATQRRFDDGHRFEELARPLAEDLIGEELFPCTGIDGKFSASFDGLTMLEDTAWEHKTLNDAIRAAVEEGVGNAINLPEHYRVQMEQQCMVSGAERALFMASKWDADGNLVEERHCWYTPDPDLRARIVAGWQQFEADVAAYQPEPAAAPVAAGRAPDQLPSLHIEVTGTVTASNLVEFKASALAVLGSINRDLQTDEDFANAEQTVKWCKGVEDRLDAAKSHALSQTASIDELFRTIDSVSAEARRIRLELDKLVTREKENRKAEIVRAAVSSVNAHIAQINATLGEHALPTPSTLQAVIGAAIKGKRTLSSIKDAADSAAAQAKIDASQCAERIRGCIAVLAEFPDHAALFADRVQLCATKQPDDLRNLAMARVADAKQREAERLERERERIRKEEAERIERERAAAELEAAKQDPEGAELSPPAQQLHEAEGAQRFAQRHPTAGMASAPAPSARIKLGDINARIGPLSITAEGLARLGFAPVGQQRAAKLYAAADFPAMCDAMVNVLRHERDLPFRAEAA